MSNIHSNVSVKNAWKWSKQQKCRHGEVHLLKDRILQGRKLYNFRHFLQQLHIKGECDRRLRRNCEGGLTVGMDSVLNGV